MDKSLEELALEETLGVEAVQKFVKQHNMGPDLLKSASALSVLDMVKELGVEKYKQVYNYLMEKIKTPSHLDKKEYLSIGLARLFDNANRGVIIFYKELANELAQPEGKRDEEKIRSKVKYFNTMVGDMVESYYENEARKEGR